MATFTAPGGERPVQYVLRLGRKMVPTVADVSLLAYRALAMIVKRTMAGRDVDGRPFAPYSTKGPIYIYANTASRPDQPREKRIAASRRLARRADMMHAFKRTRIGLKFASYAHYKASLGRANVDLMGLHAKMLQAVKARVPGAGVIEQNRPPASQSAARATQFVIGLWDKRLAEIGSAHNTGAMTGRNHLVRLPRRYWFGLSGGELAALSGMLEQMIVERVEREGAK